jgi:hypothetical protein
MQPERMRFCLQREDKASICRERRMTHFIDDRVHVMQTLRGILTHLCLIGEPGGERICPHWASFGTSWLEVVSWVTILYGPT